MASDGSVRGARGFRVGDVVEIKSREEILATLDARGELESLPFMPEMLQFCGQRVPVFRRAVKTCDPTTDDGRLSFRRMDRTVHLQGLRCDGSAHGGCKTGCLLFWKEEWLRPVNASAGSTLSVADATAGTVRGITEAGLAEAASYVDSETGETRYRCQATEVQRAAPERISTWDLTAWVRDVRSGNAGLIQAARTFLFSLFSLFQQANAKLLPRFPLIHGADSYPFLRGRLSKTPRDVLDLQPGELVRIKSLDEIRATLDTRRRNRGLVFDREMVRYCGKQARVLRRVDRIMDESTGRIRELTNDCVILEGLYCAGYYNVLCPRSNYSYFREVWLERVPVDEESEPLRRAKAESAGPAFRSYSGSGGMPGGIGAGQGPAGWSTSRNRLGARLWACPQCEQRVGW